MADVSTEDLDVVSTPPGPPAGLSASAEAAAAGARDLARSRVRILGELRRVIVGQDEAIDLVLTALVTGGHCLITGVPGLAKTRLIKALADILDLPFKRIQFTPDLMPADITGTEILDESGAHRTLTFSEGPIFAQDHPRRRDQPDAAEDAVGAARGDAGIPGHGGGATAIRCAARSSCWPPRIRSSSRGPIRCPRRSSIASCSTWSSGISPRTMKSAW